MDAAPNEAKSSGFAMLLLHIHPKTVPAEALRFSRTYGLGGMAATLLLLLAATGALLLLVYEPSAEHAYAAVSRLRDDQGVRGLVRNTHYWAGNGLVLVTFLHLLRVFYANAFGLPRRASWVVGLCLFGLVLASGFTGYLLPWDQRAYWAVTIGTGMLEYVPLVGSSLEHVVRGGADVGPRTLTTFFVLHVMLLPCAGAILVAFHFWLVRRAGGVRLPRATVRTPVPVLPHLVTREVSVALALSTGVLLLAALFDAPLTAEANPGTSPDPAKAPWYFMGLQELLVDLDPTFAVMVPLVTFGFLAGLPYLMPADRSRPARVAVRMLATVVLVGMVLLTAIGVFFRHQGMRLAWPWRGS